MTYKEETEQTEDKLELFNEFIRLLKAIKITKELLAEHELALGNLVESKDFGEALQALKEVAPDAFEDLRQKILGVKDVKTSSGF